MAVTVNGIPVTKATAGTTISIVASPAAGYEFAIWALTGAAPADATALSSMFIMPAGNVSVAAEFRQEAHTGVVINGVRWATCNVDAPGTFAATTRDAGMFYQWGRNVGWSNANPLASAPEGRTWDTSTFSGTEWPSADDPCPQGWRLPVRAEFDKPCDTEKVSRTWSAGFTFTDIATGESVSFPAAGNRTYTAGVLSGKGTYGYYWSSTGYTGNIHAYYMDSYAGVNAYTNYTRRNNGFSVRCVAK